MTEDKPGSQQLLRAGKLTEAITAASKELAADSDSIDSLYVKAVAERYLKKHKDALETLQRLQVLSPGYARAWQEEGHNHRDLGDLEAARRAYQRAVELNRALVASWRELAKIHLAQHNEKPHAVAKA